VSWQAAILIGLGLVLVGGFAWYERSRPPSQVVALVAALAALAAAGRVALSPIPNVVPTTDIVLFAGYALGPAPGFVVGALSAVASNFWLGQGPWTPWQMAGWGMCGVLGAWLAVASGRRLGRLGLATACALAGLAYGALLDFSLMVTYGGEQSLDRFLALSARGVPFNVAHAAGNFALALVAGPALVRMLTRFRRRFEFRWRSRPAPIARRGAVAAGVALVAVALAFGPGAERHQAEAAKASGTGKSVNWLISQQNPDGGFGASPGEESNPPMTGWVALGLEAAGRNPLDVGRNGASPIDYLRSEKSSITATTDLERTILVLAGAGLNPRRFGGRNLVTALSRRRDPDGSFEGQVNITAFGILALRGAGVRGSDPGVAWLRGVQNADGGWGYAPNTRSDPDSTGAVLQALAAAGGGGIQSGVGYLRSAQRADGGYSLSGGSTNSQSTSWAIQGLLAASADPGSAFRYLNGLRARDGHYRYAPGLDQTPIWVTAQVLLAVNRKPFPLAAVPRRRGGGGSGAGAQPTSGAAPAAPVAGAAPAGKPAAGKPKPKKKGKSSAKAGKQPAPVPPAPPAQSQPAAAEEEDGGSALPWLAGGGIAALAAAGAGGWLLRRRGL
jgi:energy-coupling factor transport system substrate-specific component